MSYCKGYVAVGKTTSLEKYKVLDRTDCIETKYKQYKMCLKIFKHQLIQEDIKGAKNTILSLKSIFEFNNTLHTKKEQIVIKNICTLEGMVGNIEYAEEMLKEKCGDNIVEAGMRDIDSIKKGNNPWWDDVELVRN